MSHVDDADGEADVSEQPTVPEPLQNPDNLTLKLLKRKWRRLNEKNEHWMHVIVGEEGSGKSYTALKIAKLLDPGFDEEQVFFHPAKLLEQLRDEEYEEGSVWVLDEAGVGLGNRTWYESGQVKLNQALQLVRNHNLGFIFTLPVLDDLDSQAQRRLQSALQISRKQDGEYVRGKWFDADVDRMGFRRNSNTVWWKEPTVDGSQVESVAFTPPSGDYIARYEATKDEFQQEFYDETIEEMQDDDDEEEEELSVADLVERIKDDSGIAPYLSWHGGRNKANISKEKLRDAFDLTVRDSKHLKDRLVEDPDIDIQEAWEKR